MAPLVEELAAKHDDPDLIPKSYMVERAKPHTSPLSHARTHTINIVSFYNSLGNTDIVI